MQWLEADFWLADQRFSIVGLQLFCSKETFWRCSLKWYTPREYRRTMTWSFGLFLWPGSILRLHAPVWWPGKRRSEPKKTISLHWQCCSRSPGCLTCGELFPSGLDQQAGNWRRISHLSQFFVVKWSIALAGIVFPLTVVFSRTVRRQHRV